MKLKSLKMLIKLVEKGSFSSVASDLQVSQPAVSMQIKALEDKFDTELVIREDREIKLTPAGKAIYRRAKNIISEWEQAKLEVEKLKGEPFEQLTIGASTIPASYLVPDLLTFFCDKFPEVEIFIKVGDSQEVIDKLSNREVDVIIVGTKPEDNKLEVISVVEDQLVLVVPPEDELAETSLLSIQDLAQKKMLIREEGSGTRKAMMAGLKEAGACRHDLNIRGQLESNEAVISAVESGLGVSFISKLAARKAVEQGRVKQVAVEDMLITRKFYLAYYEERKEEMPIKEFTRIAKADQLV